MQRSAAQGLSSDDSVIVVGEASDGLGAVGHVRALRPDVVLMDVRMPDLDGISATREVLAVSPEVKVVILMKLRLRDRVQAVIFAYESGLTRPRPQDRRLRRDGALEGQRYR